MSIAAMVLSTLMFFCVGCDKSQETEAAPATDTREACKSTGDCSAGFVCLSGKCAASGTKQILANPSQVITPELVKKEIETQAVEAQKRRDRAIEMSGE